MARTHRTRDGLWAACGDESCELPFHVDLTVLEAEALPERVFEDLAEAIDPPTHVNQIGTKFWYRGKQRHREYDLPAQIHVDGTRIWFIENEQHREHDRPALITADGSRIWGQHGIQHRGGGKPARINTNGYMEWWEEGQLVRTNDPKFPYGVEAQHGKPVQP